MYLFSNFSCISKLLLHRTCLNMLLWAFFFPFVLFPFKKWILWRSWPHVNALFTRIKDQQGCCAEIQKLSTSCGLAAHSLLLCRRHRYSSKGMLNLAAVLYLSLGMGWRRVGCSLDPFGSFTWKFTLKDSSERQHVSYILFFIYKL